MPNDKEYVQKGLKRLAEEMHQKRILHEKADAPEFSYKKRIIPNIDTPEFTKMDAEIWEKAAENGDLERLMREIE
ncbi:MAG: hypothetical protein KTR28_08775 [Micavibrio sp.]|nr:hypothetical protein [Micavibrio sp.]